ncbi:MAG: multicopper oxidase family protein [Bacteriovoracia bacterium]
MKFLILFLTALFITPLSEAKEVRYELVATKDKVNISGKKEVDFALQINGQIPSPTLHFQEGDEAVIRVINKIPGEELSIHWHGILLPPEEDGVPYVNTPPIFSGEERTFRFKLRQNGTYWYHSHTNVQEQKGIYGAIVIQPPKIIAVDHDVAVVISDWSDEDALQILNNLRKDGDYYLYKKNTIRSIWGAINANPGSLKNFLYNEWTRMGGMDYSDVGYDAFLINGKQQSKLLDAKKGDRVRLRVVNAAASTYFHVNLGDQFFDVVATDGMEVVPVKKKEFLIGMAETYDIEFTLPDNKSYELKITAQDATGEASSFIGNGELEKVPPRPALDQYATMDHSAHGSEHAGHMMEMGSSDVLALEDLKSPIVTRYPEHLKRHDVTLVLDGDMERYVWHINGKAIHEERSIIINENDVVKFTLVNNTMMHHPMHLHGHFFRVYNGQRAFAPLKHTIDVAPHTTRTIEFLANEPGEWMLHCHNLYHLKTGMARVISYSTYKPGKEIQPWLKKDPHLHDHWYHYGMLEAATNHTQARFRSSQTWNEFDLRIEARKDFSWNGEGDLFYRRWKNRNVNFFAGGSGIDDEYMAVAGVGYLLPMLIESQFMIDHEGRLRLDLEKRIQWTSTWYTDAEFTFRQKLESEFEISLMYSRQWDWSVGLMFTEDSAGLGVQYQF